MKTRKLLCLLIAFVMVLGIMPLVALTAFAEDEADQSTADESVTAVNGEYSLTVSKTQFQVGEPINISANYVAANDWVGIYTTNESASIYWDNVSSYGSGTFFDIREATQYGSGYTEELGAIPEGRYVIRLVPNGTANLAETVCQIVITVGNPEMVEGDSSLMSIEKTTYAPGESVMVSGKGSGKDWIGFYRANYHNVTYNNMWKYIADVGEDTEFDVTGGNGLPEGDYVLCLIKNDGTQPKNASAWAYITVCEQGDDGSGGEQEPDEGGATTPEEGEIPEGMEKYTSANGQSIYLKTEYDKSEPVYVIANGVNAKDWVGITERGKTEAAIRWCYIDSSAGGAGQGALIDLRQAQNVGGPYISSALASLPAGEYTVHLAENDGYIKNGASVIAVDITIKDESAGGDEGGDDNTGGEAPETELLKLEKTTFKLGEAIMVTAVSSDEKDWVGIFDASGNYLKWHYVPSSLSGVPCDITQGAVIPAGVYTIRLIPKDGAKNTTPLASIEIVIKEEGPSAPTSATYNIENDGNGYAKGTISVTMPSDDLTGRSIVMYWADANGRLEGYTALARFKVTDKTTTFTFTDSMVIPSGATRLLVYSQASSTGVLSDEYLSIDLPSGSDMKEETPITSFFIISDIHIGKSGSAENFKKMLNEAIKLNPNGAAIFIVGDMADGGTEAQFAEMMSLHDEVMSANGKDGDKYPLYLTLGNHDYPAMSSIFLQYAKLPDGTHPTDTSYDFWLNGYHYIFLGSDQSSGLYATLTDETLAWLDERLSEDRDSSRPTFVFLHQPMYNTVSGSLPGEGWNGVNNEQALRDVLAKYPEVMFFNGHTHWTMDSVGNIFEGTEELPIHIFNCASVSYLWSGYNIVTGEGLSGSQGYYIEIYDGGVFVRGRDFINGEWISSAQYLIELDACESHDYQLVDVTYENGFDKAGLASYRCSNCDKAITEELLPIISSKGYSVSLYDSGAKGFTSAYSVCPCAKELYERANGVTLDMGVLVIDPARASEDSFLVDGRLATEDGAIDINISASSLLHVGVSIKNIGEAQLDVGIIISAYVTVIEGADEKSYNTAFIQHQVSNVAGTITKSDAVLYSMSYNSASKEVNK